MATNQVHMVSLCMCKREKYKINNRQCSCVLCVQEGEREGGVLLATVRMGGMETTSWPRYGLGNWQCTISGKVVLIMCTGGRANTGEKQELAVCYDSDWQVYCKRQVCYDSDWQWCRCTANRGKIHARNWLAKWCPLCGGSGLNGEVL